MHGLSLQVTNIVSPLAGWFGLSVQNATNVLLRITDEQGKDLTGVTVSYPSGGSTVTFTTSAISSLYQLAVPVATTTTITLSRPGYVTQSFQVTVANGDFLTVSRTMALSIVPYTLIMKAK